MVERDTFVKIADSDQLNDGYFNSITPWTIRPALLNTISQLQDHTVTFGNGDGIFAEAYINADGRLLSVNTDETTASFLVNRYDTVSSADSIVYHNLSPNTFSATIDKSVGVVKLAGTETGASVEYKLFNRSAGPFVRVQGTMTSASTADDDFVFGMGVFNRKFFLICKRF